jgi:hypothetical protein
MVSMVINDNFFAFSFIFTLLLKLNTLLAVNKSRGTAVDFIDLSVNNQLAIRGNGYMLPHMPLKRIGLAVTDHLSIVNQRKRSTVIGCNCLYATIYSVNVSACQSGTADVSTIYVVNKTVSGLFLANPNLAGQVANYFAFAIVVTDVIESPLEDLSSRQDYVLHALAENWRGHRHSHKSEQKAGSEQE